jgi:hypothetical protein
MGLPPSPFRPGTPVAFTLAVPTRVEDNGCFVVSVIYAAECARP